MGVHWEGLVLQAPHFQGPRGLQQDTGHRTQLIRSTPFPYLCSGLSRSLREGAVTLTRERLMSEAQKDCDVQWPTIKKEKCATQSEDRVVDCANSWGQEVRRNSMGQRQQLPEGILTPPLFQCESSRALRRGGDQRNHSAERNKPPAQSDDAHSLVSKQGAARCN